MRLGGSILGVWAPRVLALVMVWATGGGGWGWGDEPAREMAQTVLTASVHRLGLLQTLEAYASGVLFHGPGSTSQLPDFVKTDFCVVDRTEERWLYEMRRHFGGLEVPFGAAMHTVAAFNQGTWATREARNEAWLTSAQVSWDAAGYFLFEHLLCRATTPQVMVRAQYGPPTAIGGELDGVRCLCLRLRQPGDRRVRYEEYVWVDPERGFAVLKEATLTIEGGKVTRDDIRRSYGLRECAPGLWLPERVDLVTCVVPQGQAERVWSDRRVYRVVDLKVNEPLTADYFGPLVFAGPEQYPTSRYDLRLVDPGDPLQPGEEDDPAKVRLRQIIPELLEELERGPGDPATFIEPLPEPYGEGG